MDEIVQLATQVLQTTPVRWLALSQTLDVPLMRRQPAPGRRQHERLHRKRPNPT